MVEPLGLGSGVHDLKLGSSFDQSSGVGFHSIRYDFKPASVDTKKMASLNIEEGKSVTVTVPHMAGSGTTHTVYKGNKRPLQKECVLIIDHQTGEITLEKLSNTLQLKKTSCRDALKKKTSCKESGRIRMQESSHSSTVSELERRIGEKLDINADARQHRKSHHSKSKKKHKSSSTHKLNCSVGSQSENLSLSEKEKFCLESFTQSRHSKMKNSFKTKNRGRHKLPEHTMLTCILLSDDSDGLPDLDFSQNDIVSSAISLDEQKTKEAPPSVGPSTNTGRPSVACSLSLSGDGSNELPDIEMTHAKEIDKNFAGINQLIESTNKHDTKYLSYSTVKTERSDLSSKTPQGEKSLVNGSRTSRRDSPILTEQRVDKEKARNRYTKQESTNITKLGHKAQGGPTPGLPQKGPNETKSSSPPKEINIVKFAQTIKKDILTFLQSHKLEVSRRPYVSSSFSVTEFEHSHKTLYDRALKRASLPDHSLNELIKFLCREYREYVIGQELLGYLQRLEDVCDFILDKMEQSQKDGGSGKHMAWKEVTPR